MKISFPSPEFDDAIAAVCHGTASDEQSRALNELLRHDAAALDEYILRLELHSRLASDPDLFALHQAPASISEGSAKTIVHEEDLQPTAEGPGEDRWKAWTIALAACFALLATGLIATRQVRPSERTVSTSKAVAMLSRTADAQWSQAVDTPRLGAPMEPGWFRLKAGLAQVIFYSGARVVIEGPAEFQLISENEALCQQGRIVAEVPPQARAFRVRTPHAILTDLPISFGLDVQDETTEVDVFKGKGTFRPQGASEQTLAENLAAVIPRAGPVRIMAARAKSFDSLFDLEARSVAADARRHNQWRTACKRLETDPSLVLRFDFESVAPSGWQLRNLGKPPGEVSDATIVGCQWTEGRFAEKRALEFQNVSDRVRLTVPGEFQALSLAAWVCVKGLDRKINSLFMSDGFAPGTIHWLIRRDGVLGLTVIGADSGAHQIIASPPVVTLDKLGIWMHLAVVLDSSGKLVTHYVNGLRVSENTLKMPPLFRIGSAELGNWNAKGFPKGDPFMIRNFSGALDEFCLFSRALSAGEIRALYSQGKPQPEMSAKSP